MVRACVGTGQWACSLGGTRVYWYNSMRHGGWRRAECRMVRYGMAPSTPPPALPPSLMKIFTNCRVKSSGKPVINCNDLINPSCIHVFVQGGDDFV